MVHIFWDNYLSVWHCRTDRLCWFLIWSATSFYFEIQTNDGHCMINQIITSLASTWFIIPSIVITKRIDTETHVRFRTLIFIYLFFDGKWHLENEILTRKTNESSSISFSNSYFFRFLFWCYDGDGFGCYDGKWQLENSNEGSTALENHVTSEFLDKNICVLQELLTL